MVSRALDIWLLRWAGQDVLVELDNSTAVAYLNKQGGTRSCRLCRLATLILLRCDDHGMTLRARHIPGVRNVIADALSRRGEIAQGEWNINRQVFLRLCNLWGTPTVDLFATRYNFRLTLHISPVPDVRAMAVDAMSLNWKGMWGYAYPPLALLPLVLRKNRQHLCEVILIASLWPEARWFIPLLQLLVDCSASSSSYRSLDTGSTAPPRPFKPEASRMEIVGQALRQQGFSEQVAERAARPQRESTLLIYESK